jgi:putative transposase
MCISMGSYSKRSWAGEVRTVSLLVSIAVNNLGIREGAKEDKAGWSGFLKHLRRMSRANRERC